MSQRPRPLSIFSLAVFLRASAAAMDPRLKSLNPNKHLKEEFVSNLTGSSMLEIVFLSAIVPVLILLRHCINSSNLKDVLNAMEIKPKKNDNFVVGYNFWMNCMINLVMDFLCIIVPVIFIFTVLADWTCACAVCLVLALILCITSKRFLCSNSYTNEGLPSSSSLRMSISSYRVSVMIITCVCILAVDFKIYPRRYAKTETFGTGLMDLGVGSFVVANALVSRQARNITSLKWGATLQSVSPLVLLGFARLVFTTGISYQVHVGEYGVHWNFFFTLAAVSILSAMINIHPQYCGILGASILIGYQICLKCGLNDYLLSNKREANLISQNKEGLFSIFGYWGMYLIGIQLGNHLFFDSGKKMRGIQWAIIRAWFLSLLFWSLTIILDKHVERVSRRMCNLAYVSFVFAQNFQVLAILMLSDFVPGPNTSLIEEAFNWNLLGCFLLANVLTGIINLWVDTLAASSLMSFLILLGYAFLLTLFAGFSMFFGVKLKFW